MTDKQTREALQKIVERAAYERTFSGITDAVSKIEALSAPAAPPSPSQPSAPALPRETSND